MQKFQTREEYQEWADTQLKKYGIRQPNFFDQQDDFDKKDSV